MDMMPSLAVRQPSIDRLSPIARLGARAGAAARPAYLQPVPATTPDDDVTARLQAIGVTLSFARGKTIVHDGDPSLYVFKVVTGALRAVRLLPDGRRCIIGFRLPGDFFGFTDKALATDSIEVLSDAKIVRYPRAAFEAVLNADAPASRHFFDLLCQELCAAQDRLLMLGRKSAVERIATFLLALADRKSTGGNCRDLDLPMTRADMADYLGLTIETVSRVLSNLRNRCIIRLTSTTHIIFNDRAALEAIRDVAA
jgi:CRP-like cAMP-binding protein